MARRSKKSSGIGWMILLVVVAFAAAAGIAYYFARSGGEPVQPPEKKPVVVKPPIIRPVEERTVTIFVPEVKNNRFYLAPVKKKTDRKGDILDVAVEELLATSGGPGEAGKLIPKGTQLLSSVEVHSGVARVDLSDDFVNNFSGGSIQEALVLNSIAHTLVQYKDKDVKRVQILVEGKEADSLGGHFDLAVPFAPDHTLLQPE